MKRIVLLLAVVFVFTACVYADQSNGGVTKDVKKLAKDTGNDVKVVEKKAESAVKVAAEATTYTAGEVKKSTENIIVRAGRKIGRVIRHIGQSIEKLFGKKDK